MLCSTCTRTSLPLFSLLVVLVTTTTTTTNAFVSVQRPALRVSSPVGTFNFKNDIMVGPATTSTTTSIAAMRRSRRGPSSSASATATAPTLRRRVIGDVWQEQQRKASASGSMFSSFCILPGCCAPPPSLLYCSAVTEGDASDSDSSISSSSSEGAVGAISSKTTTTTASTPPVSGTPSWKDSLLRYSNYASALCVLDCTVLPAVTLLLPLLGLVAAPTALDWLHRAGHQLALYFVLPVGFTATTTNYLYNHKTAWITAVGWLGLLLVFASNAHLHWGAHGSLLRNALHLVHHGWAHRAANLAGCALLIGSNYLSRQRGCGSANCGHDHSHSHHHRH